MCEITDPDSLCWLAIDRVGIVLGYFVVVSNAGLRRAEGWMQSEGVSELHLFLKAPVAVGAAVGAIFDSWVPVELDHQQRGAYEAWTTLYEAKRPPLDEQLGEAVAGWLAR